MSRFLSGVIEKKKDSLQFSSQKFSLIFFCIVTVFPKILKSSGCKLGSKVLTCVCVSVGIPLPTIRWLQLGNHSEYTVITTVSKHTINSTFSVTVNDDSSPVVDCISSNKNGEIKDTLMTTDISTQEGECFSKEE